MSNHNGVPVMQNLIICSHLRVTGSRHCFDLLLTFLDIGSAALLSGSIIIFPS